MTACVRHTAPITLYRDPNCSLSAGAFETPEPLGAAVLSLADGKRPRVLKGLPGYRPVRISLEWQDMTVPHYTRDDWEWLAGRLRKLPRLHVHCRAGHGRTGTALAILASLWDMVPRDMCPVTWVRERYCPNAVETAAQIAYVARITDRTVIATPSLGGGAVMPRPPLGGVDTFPAPNTVYRTAEPRNFERYFPEPSKGRSARLADRTERNLD